MEVTDDERRRIAKILRGGYDVVSDDFGRFWLNGTLFGLNIMARSEERIRDGLSRLADLIDPDTTSDTTKTASDTTKSGPDTTTPTSSDITPNSHPDCGTQEVQTSQVPECDTSQSRRDTVACDREALLALADDLETYRLPISGIAIAEHIREACWVES